MECRVLRASNSCRTKVEFRHEPSSYQLTISHQKVACFRTKSSRVTRHAVTVTSTARLACCTTPALASTGIDELTRRDRFAVVSGLIREPGRPAAGSRLLSEVASTIDSFSLRRSIGHDVAGRAADRGEWSGFSAAGRGPPGSRCPPVRGGRR